MSISNDGDTNRLLQERWREIGLSQADLAEVLCGNAGAARDGGDPAAAVDDQRLMAIAEALGIADDITRPRQARASAKGRDGSEAASLDTLLELRLLRVFRALNDPDTKRVLIELAEQIVKRQPTGSETA